MKLKETDLGVGADATHLAARASAVFERLRRGTHSDLESARLRQIVPEHALEDPTLGLGLQRVVEMLPLAAAARAEVGTGRLLPSGTGFDALDDLGADEVLLLLDRPHPHAVAGRREWHEDDLPLVPPQTGAAIDELLDRELERLRGRRSCVAAPASVARVRSRAESPGSLHR